MTPSGPPDGESIPRGDLWVLALKAKAAEAAIPRGDHTSVEPKQALMRWTNARRRAVSTLPRRR